MGQIFSPTTNTLAKLSIYGAVVVPLGILFGGSAISRSPYNTNVGVTLNQPIPFSHKHHANELGIDCRYCHTSVEKTAFAGVPPTHTCMSCHSQIWTNSPILEPLRQSWRSNEPLIWNRVNKLPEFVYFNHSIHIARGISCNQCHGAIQKMQVTSKGFAFSMKWCLDCHREPEKYLYSDEAHPNMTPQDQALSLYKKIQSGVELTPREEALKEGLPYQATAAEIEKGKELVAKLKVKKEQLADCWTCHR